MATLEDAYKELVYIRHRPSQAKPFSDLCALIEDLKVKFPQESIVYLLEAYNFIRIGSFEEALASVTCYFDFYGSSANSKVDKRRYCTLKHGLALVATLHRMFGSYTAGSSLLSQALGNAHDNHDIAQFRLASMEEKAFNMNALNLALTPTFRREPRTHAQIMDLKKKFMILFHSHDNTVQMTGLEETFTNLVAAGFALRNNKYRALAQHFRISMLYLRALHGAVRCESPENLSKCLSMCVEAEVASQWRRYSRDVQDGVMAIRSTIQLANGCVALPSNIHLFKETVSNSRVTEGQLVMGVNAAYSYAYQGMFDNAQLIITQLKKYFPYDSNPMLAIHWRVASQCISFDEAFFKGNLEVAEELLPELAQLSEPEYLFRRALMDFVHCNYNEAELNGFLKKLNKGTDPHLKIRCRIAVGNLRVLTGDLNSGIEQLERAVRSADKCNLKYLEVAAQRRLAHAYLTANKIPQGESLLNEVRLRMEDPNLPNLEKFLYYATWFELWSKKAAVRTLSKAEGVQVVRYITLANRALPPSFTLLRQSFHYRTTIFAHQHLEDLTLANSLAKMCFECKELAAFKFNWFVL